MWVKISIAICLLNRFIWRKSNYCKQTGNISWSWSKLLFLNDNKQTIHHKGLFKITYSKKISKKLKFKGNTKNKIKFNIYLNQRITL
jgi:hypothetical protein